MSFLSSLYQSSSLPIIPVNITRKKVVGDFDGNYVLDGSVLLSEYDDGFAIQSFPKHSISGQSAASMAAFHDAIGNVMKTAEDVREIPWGIDVASDEDVALFVSLYVYPDFTKGLSKSVHDSMPLVNFYRLSHIIHQLPVIPLIVDYDKWEVELHSVYGRVWLGSQRYLQDPMLGIDEIVLPDIAEKDKKVTSFLINKRDCYLHNGALIYPVNNGDTGKVNTIKDAIADAIGVRSKPLWTVDEKVKVKQTDSRHLSDDPLRKLMKLTPNLFKRYTPPEELGIADSLAFVPDNAIKGVYR